MKSSRNAENKKMSSIQTQNNLHQSILSSAVGQDSFVQSGVFNLEINNKFDEIEKNQNIIITGQMVCESENSLSHRHLEEQKQADDHVKQIIFSASDLNDDHLSSVKSENGPVGKNKENIEMSNLALPKQDLADSG